MSYVPGCSADVFISYAHHDNRDGWVTRLKEKLAEKLNPFLAGRAEVWFDDRIAPGTYFQQEIQQKLKPDRAAGPATATMTGSNSADS